MIVYVILVLVIIIGAVFIKSDTSKRNYCIIIGIMLLILIGCRHISMGISDTENIYIPTYERILETNFRDINKVFYKDLLFHYTTKIFTYIFNNSQLWLALVAFPLILFFCKFVYKYSERPSLSFLLFLALNYYGMCFTLMRHSIALALVICSYSFLKERKLTKFVLIILLASMFHKTAIVFLVAYPLYTMKFNIKQFIVIIIALMLSVTVGDKLFSIVLSILKAYRYQSYADSESSLSLMNFYINFLILMCSFVFYRYFSKENSNEIEGLMNLNTISCIALAFTPVLGEMYRISMFFGIFNTILLPNVLALKGKNDKYKTMIYFCMYLIFILYFLGISLQNAQIIPYKFFWQ